MPSELIYLAATAASEGGLSGTSIAALIAAVGGALGGIFTGIRSLRGDKFKQNVEAGAALLQGYTDMVQVLRAELDRVKEAQYEEREGWRKEREAMRAEWHAERDRMRTQHAQEIQLFSDRVDDLSAQIYVLHHRNSDRGNPAT